MVLREVTTDDLQQLAGAAEPLLVAFVRADCPWCERLQPELERIAADWGERLDIVTLRVDKAPAAAADYRLRGTPTVMLMRGGERLGSKHGFQRAQQLDAFLKHHLNPDRD